MAHCWRLVWLIDGDGVGLIVGDGMAHCWRLSWLIDGDGVGLIV